MELLKAALADPHNQRFQLLCEGTVPVRPATFTYEQLMAQNRSRVPWLQMHKGPSVQYSAPCLQRKCIHGMCHVCLYATCDGTERVFHVQDVNVYAYRFPLPAHESYPALKHHMRTHAQFFMLVRAHVRLIVEDTELLGVFRAHSNRAYAR